MIEGKVSADREAIMDIIVVGQDGKESVFNGVVDTGFTGWLTLPPHVIRDLGLVYRKKGSALLADGSQVLYDVYEGTVIWDGQRANILIGEADSEPLIGMTLMYGYELVLPIIDGAGFRLTRI